MVPTTPSLVGREHARTVLQSHLDEGVLLVSGTGGAGIGVTSLARRLAADVADQYPDGCIEIALHGSRRGYSAPLAPEVAQRQVLRTFYPTQPPPENPQALRRAYQAALAEHRAILLFDDAANIGQLRHLLPKSGGGVIVTAETDLASSLPKFYPLTVSGLSPDEGAHLIIQITPEAGTFPRARLRKLSAALDGVPLALRILAPLLGQRPLLAPRKALAQLDQAHKRIIAIRGAQSTTMPADSAIEVAYEFLDVTLRPDVQALAVFPAAFDPTAVASVWDVPLATANQRLEHFVQLGFVTGPHPTKGYEVHDLVRLYAQELLLGQPEQTREFVARYVAHYLREAIRVAALLVNAPGAESPSGREVSLLCEHVPVAWARAVGADPGWPKPEGMDRWICDFPPHSKALLDLILTRPERLVWLAQSLDAAESLGDARAVATRLGELGQVYAALEDYSQALAHYERQLAVARDNEALDIEGEALMNTGLVYGSQGDLTQAAESWQRSLRAFGLSGDPRAARVRTWLQELQSRSRS